MNKGRLLLAGVLAGLAVFVWGMLSHMVFGLSEAAVKSLPNEPAVLTARHQNIKRPASIFIQGEWR